MEARENQNPIDTKAAKSLEFKNSLERIQSTPLNPGNIDFYASDALAELINLTGSITNEYAKGKSGEKIWGKELEDSAFMYFGLGNIGEILDHVASKENEIKKIGQKIEWAENIDSTIVPPQEGTRPIQEGDGNFEKKEIISRTKTLLFILANDLDIDIDDPEQLSLKTGILSDNMMRESSYFMINAPSLNRTILCCDEEGNVTYIFDNTILNRHEISPDELVGLSKPKINELLGEDPKLGKRIVYSKNFVPRMIGLIENLEENETSMPQEERGLYLYPKPPEGALTARGISDKLGLGHRIVDKMIEELRDNLGKIGTYKFRTHISEGYSSEQQEKIRQALKDRGVLSGKAPEGILSANGLTRKLRVTHTTVDEVIEELGDELGKIGAYRFGTRTTEGYNSEQQEKIRQALKDRGVLSEKVPEGILSKNNIANNLGISYRPLNAVIEELGDELGKIGTYRFGTQITEGYNSEQQEKIKQALKDRGTLSEKAPEGVLSASGLTRKLRVNHATVDKVIEELEGKLGEIGTYKFGGQITEGYTSEQQEMIKQVLKRKGFIKA